MRSIIFTKWFAFSGVLAVLGLAAGFSAAQGGPSHGCYARDYSDAHLAKQPAQVVDQIVMRVRLDDSGSTTIAELAVLSANQGHARASGLGGRRFDQFLICWSDGAKSFCAVECDGGSMEITHDTGKILQFRTDYLIVGDRHECGGVFDLAERPGVAVSYRLERVSKAVCDGF